MRVIGEGKRDELKQHLIDKGIGCEVYYPVPLHRQECFESLPAHAIQACPVSERLSTEVLSIPIYPELVEAQRQEVVDAIAGFLA